MTWPKAVVAVAICAMVTLVTVFAPGVVERVAMAVVVGFFIFVVFSSM